MPRRDGETTLSGSGFWSPDRILLIVVFILGMLLGGYITNKFIDQGTISSANADTNSLVQENARLDKRSDVLAKCLVENGIAPETCG